MSVPYRKCTSLGILTWKKCDNRLLKNLKFRDDIYLCFNLWSTCFFLAFPKSRPKTVLDLYNNELTNASFQPSFKHPNNKRSLNFTYRGKKSTSFSTWIKFLAVFNSRQNKNVSFLQFSGPVIRNTVNGGMRIG